MSYEEDEINKVWALTKRCKEHNTFEYDGLLVDGYHVDIAKRYVLENPSKKFRTWIIDEDLVIKEL